MIPVAEPWLGEDEIKNVLDCVKSGWVSSIGKYVEKFEKEFVRFCGVKYGVSTSSGTTALHLALSALEIKEGDEVIVPTLTFIATANAVTYAGAKPIFVDSEIETWNIDPHKIEQKITKRTKAIVVVHLYGHPANIIPILKIAKKYNLYVIEDAAEAHGAEYQFKKVGSFGDIACFSFYGNKIITTGEGGMCITNNKKLAEKMGFLKDHGMSKKKRYWHPVIGFNYRLTNLQAAMGLAQLKKIKCIIKKKRQIAKTYNDLLQGTKGISLPPEMPWAKNVFWLYSILIEYNFRFTRNRLMQKLKENGVDNRPFFYPIHILPPYSRGEKYPIAEKLSKSGISLPSSPSLTKADIEKVVQLIQGK